MTLRRRVQLLRRCDPTAPPDTTCEIPSGGTAPRSVSPEPTLLVQRLPRCWSLGGGPAVRARSERTRFEVVSAFAASGAMAESIFDARRLTAALRLGRGIFVPCRSGMRNRCSSIVRSSRGSAPLESDESSLPALMAASTVACEQGVPEAMSRCRSSRTSSASLHSMRHLSMGASPMKTVSHSLVACSPSCWPALGNDLPAY